MKEKLIVALDVNDLNKIKLLVDKLQSVVKYFKVGAIPFTYFGPELVRFLKDRGLKVMLDLKYHDIPNTVARACEGAMELGVDMLTMHISGGFTMMEEAVKAVSLVSDIKNISRPRLLGITVLTSIDEAYFKDLFGDVKRTIEEQVIFLARLAQSAGLDGVVASPQEITRIRENCGQDFLIITPGIRSEGEMVDDQARTMTAGQAIRAGADYIVVGRPIVAARDPLQAAKQIIKEMENAG
ncbi:MAG: orotidine-5'-phosphate decarboxylase [candidate division WOR-3 bacterium]|nr:orotidine-5'-phosphate decarboxylase [candidate division WOR-3 bacterium]